MQEVAEDFRLVEKYGGVIGYKKLVQLNVEWKYRSVALARLLNTKDESMKSAIIQQDIMAC